MLTYGMTLYGIEYRSSFVLRRQTEKSSHFTHICHNDRTKNYYFAFKKETKKKERTYFHYSKINYYIKITINITKF